MSKKVILWGATGLAKVLWEILSYDGHEVVAVFDNNSNVKELSPIKKAPVYHGEEGFMQWRKSGAWDNQEIYGIVAVGGSRGRDRHEIQDFFIRNGVKPYTAIHPRAFVSRDASLGVGCQVMANAAVASEAVLGDACIVNTSANVDQSPQRQLRRRGARAGSA